MSRYRIGCAGWSIPRKFAGDFPAEGSHLERYAARFCAVEINSSFHRSHRTETYARWAAATPDDFRFSVKVPKEITHTRKLVDTAALVEQLLGEASGLGEKLGPLLVQLPPSLAFDQETVEGFFRQLRLGFAGNVVCEPRHASWFTPEVDRSLAELEIARVAADPALAPGAEEPGGWTGLTYYRLHGSPRVYYSSYSDADLNALAAKMRVGGWSVFDNTAGGEAIGNALELRERLDSLPIEEC